MGWERIGAGGKQHGNNGAVLASAWGMGRGRHLPALSPALPTNYTNSTATAPPAKAKGPYNTQSSNHCAIMDNRQAQNWSAWYAQEKIKVRNENSGTEQSGKRGSDLSGDSGGSGGALSVE